MGRGEWPGLGCGGNGAHASREGGGRFAGAWRGARESAALADRQKPARGQGMKKAGQVTRTGLAEESFLRASRAGEVADFAQ